MSQQKEATRLLAAWTDGDRDALDALMPLVYGELRRVAHRQLARARNDHTLNTTDLVHEAFLKLVRLDQVDVQGRAHFLALAAKAMRHILVDYAVRRNAAKRGGNPHRLSLDTVKLTAGTQPDDLLALDDALRRLETLDERQSRVVECRFFSGMTVEETAEALGVSETTVKRDWRVSRAWLNRELAP